MTKGIHEIEYRVSILLKSLKERAEIILLGIYILFLFVLLLLPVFGWLVSLVERSQGIITVFFSGLLVILYFMQYRTQKTQKEISQKQSEYTEAANKPLIVVEEWYTKGNEVFFELSNVGNGIAQDLSFQVGVGVVEESPLLKSKTVGGEMKEHPAALVRVEENDDEDKQHNPSNYLLEGERNIKFKAKAVSPKEWLDEPSHSLTASFTKAMEYYREEEKQKIYLNPVLMYRDISDNKNYERLLSEIVSPYVVWDFEDAIKSERKIGVGFPSTVPENHIVHENPEEYTMTMHGTDYSEPRRPLTPIEIETIQKMKTYEEGSLQELTELDDFEEI